MEVVMKKCFLLAGALFVLSATMIGQFKQKDVELAFSGTLGSWSEKMTSGGSSHSESAKYLSLFVEPGFYVADGLSLEPEFGVMALENEPPTFYLLGNVSYTYLPPDSRTAIYALAGYGVSNAVQYPIYNGAIVKLSKKMDVTVLNVGFGIKALVSERVALRVGFNYKDHRYSPENTYNYNPYGYTPSTVEYSYSNVGLLMGFSVLL